MASVALRTGDIGGRVLRAKRPYLDADVFPSYSWWKFNFRKTHPLLDEGVNVTSCARELFQDVSSTSLQTN